MGLSGGVRQVRQAGGQQGEDLQHFAVAALSATEARGSAHGRLVTPCSLACPDSRLSGP